LVVQNTPGGGRTNKDHFGAAVELTDSIDARVLQLLYDPQTSGGLLVAVAPGSAAEAVQVLERAGVGAHEVGGIEAVGPGRTVAVTVR
jgi:selenide,water dikinase